MPNNISCQKPSSFLKCFIVRRTAFHLSEPEGSQKMRRERSVYKVAD